MTTRNPFIASGADLTLLSPSVGTMIRFDTGDILTVTSQCVESIGFHDKSWITRNDWRDAVHRGEVKRVKENAWKNVD
jgi:hypothetical protein